MDKGSWTTIVCFKHDGSVHRSWNKSMFVDETNEYSVFANDDALVLESDGRNWKVKEPSITIFYKHKWFNVIAMLRDEGIKYYVNIASPYIITQDTVCYIDYDLDVSYKKGTPIKILDEHEYMMHYESMHYDKKLDYILKDALYEVLNMIEQKAFPFDDKTISLYYAKFLKLKEDK